MLVTTSVQCLHPNGNSVSGEALELTLDCDGETNKLTLGRHERAIHVSLPILMRELTRMHHAREATKAVQQ